MPCRFDEIFEAGSVPELCCIHEGYLPKAHSVQEGAEMTAVLAVHGQASNELRIESYSEFHPDVRQARGLRILRQLRICERHEKRADAVWKEVGGRSTWVGLHFRGTDSMTVGLEGFVKKIQAAPHQHFFFATDEAKVKEGFVGSMFADRVHIVRCAQGRRTPEEFLDALTEWLLLQKTATIYGSIKSSFSELAALRAGIPYEAISSAGPSPTS
jgi:hypothetical protein